MVFSGFFKNVDKTGAQDKGRWDAHWASSSASSYRGRGRLHRLSVSTTWTWSGLHAKGRNLALLLLHGGCPAEQPKCLWFRYGTHKSENLFSNGCRSKTDKYTLENPAQNQVSLTVNRLTFNDSAIYICGIAFPNSKQPRAKQTGGGTVLVVRGQSKLYSRPVCSAWSLTCITYFYAEIRRYIW